MDDFPFTVWCLEGYTCYTQLLVCFVAAVASHTSALLRYHCTGHLGCKGKQNNIAICWIYIWQVEQKKVLVGCGGSCCCCRMSIHSTCGSTSEVILKVYYMECSKDWNVSRRFVSVCSQKNEHPMWFLEHEKSSWMLRSVWHLFFGSVRSRHSH